jgi:hypothetical protein
MGRAIDLLISYRVIKLLVTPWKEQEAYKYGIIDDNGKVLRKAKDLRTSKEKESYTLLHRFVFNLKRILQRVGLGSKIGNYAAALGLLLKEQKELNAVEIERSLYKYLVDNKLIAYKDDLKESVGFDYLPEGRYTVIDDLRDLENNSAAEVGDIVSVPVDTKPFDNYFGVNLYNVVNEDTQKQIIISEDNIERIKF